MSFAEPVDPINLDPPGFTRRLWLGQLLAIALYFPQRLRKYLTDYARAAHGGTPAESAPPQSLSPDEWQQWWAASPIQVHLLGLLGRLTLSLSAFMALVYGLLWMSFSGSNGRVWSAIVLGWLTALLVTFMQAAIALFFFGKERDDYAALLPSLGAAWTCFIISVVALAFDGAPGGITATFIVYFGAGLLIGLALSVFLALRGGSFNTRAIHYTGAAAVGVAAFFLLAVATPAQSAPTITPIVGLIAMGLGAFVGILRLDDWLFAWIFRISLDDPSAPDLLGPQRLVWHDGFRADESTTWRDNLGRVTPLPLVYLRPHLNGRLNADWERGFSVARQLWQHTAQQDAVRNSLQLSLEARANDDLVQKVARIADTGAAGPRGDTWEMVLYGEPWRSAIGMSKWRYEEKPKTPAERMARDRRRLRAREAGLPPLVPDQPVDSAAQAVLAGFWYLDRGYFAAARDALAKGPSSPFGKEMRDIVEALRILADSEHLVGNLKLKLPERPLEPFRKPFWNMLDDVRDLLRVAALHDRTPETETRKRSEARQLAAHLRQKLEDGPELQGPPPVEVRQLRALAARWSKPLAAWLQTAPVVPPPSLLRPVTNPYVTSPVVGRWQFQGRRPEVAQLKAFWSAGNLQPVLLYGLPLVGKTSLLRQTESERAAAFQLVRFQPDYDPHAPPSRARLLADLWAAVRDVARPEVIPGAEPSTPPVRDFAGVAEPYALCRHRISEACRWTQARTLILVLDNYDALHRVIAAQPALERFPAFIQELSQSIPNLNVVVVSERPPALFPGKAVGLFEGEAHPLFLKPLAQAEMYRLLNRFDLNLPVAFLPSARRAIWALSGGHPYLAQLIAYQVVQNYNRQAAADKGVALFGHAEVLAACQTPVFQERAQLFYRRVDEWVGEAGAEVHALVDALARAGQGQAVDDLIAKLVDPNAGPVHSQDRLTELLAALEEFGLLAQDAATGRYRLPIGLYRDWWVAHH